MRSNLSEEGSSILIIKSKTTFSLHHKIKPYFSQNIHLYDLVNSFRKATFKSSTVRCYGIPKTSCHDPGVFQGDEAIYQSWTGHHFQTTNKVIASVKIFMQTQDSLSTWSMQFFHKPAAPLIHAS